MTEVRDPLLEPYFIKIHEFDYSLCITITPKEKYSETGGKEYTKTLGYYSSVISCVRAFIRINGIKLKTKYNSVIEYMEELKKIDQYNTNELKKFEI